MKKTLSILAVAALALGVTTSYADEEDVTLKAQCVGSLVTTFAIAPGATLIDTHESGKVVKYSVNDNTAPYPPFNPENGASYWEVNLYDKNNNPITLETASDLKIGENGSLIIDFTATQYLGFPDSVDYMVFMFRGKTADGYRNDFADWYKTNRISITGKFSNGEYDAFVIDETCDLSQSGFASTFGGLVFFSKDVLANVRSVEVDPSPSDPTPSPSVPEPTTATLSLLALAGLAARRRRR